MLPDSSFTTNFRLYPSLVVESSPPKKQLHYHHLRLSRLLQPQRSASDNSTSTPSASSLSLLLWSFQFICLSLPKWSTTSIGQHLHVGTAASRQLHTCTHFQAHSRQPTACCTLLTALTNNLSLHSFASSDAAPWSHQASPTTRRCSAKCFWLCSPTHYTLLSMFSCAACSSFFSGCQ